MLGTDLGPRCWQDSVHGHGWEGKDLLFFSIWKLTLMRLEEEKWGDLVGIGWIKREGKAGKNSVGPQEAQSHLIRGSEKGQRVWAVTGSGGAGQRHGGSYSLSSCKDPWRERVASCHSALGDQAWPECRNQSSHRPNRLWGIKTFPSCWWLRRLCKSSLVAALSRHLDHQLCERQGSWTRDLVMELGACTTVNGPTPPPSPAHSRAKTAHSSFPPQTWVCPSIPPQSQPGH